MSPNIWHRITQIGITGNLDSREARRISYVNYIALLAILYLFVRVLVSLSNPSYCVKLFSLTIFGVVILFLNKFHYYTAAKICSFVVFIGGASFFSYFFLGGFKEGTYVVLFAGVPWPFMLFDIKQKANIVCSLCLIFVCFSLIIILQYTYPLPPKVELNLDIARISTTALTIVMLLLFTWYFHSSNMSAEEKLIEEKGKSDASNRAKSEFLANMSHELRTPLNAILGFSELMKRDSSFSPGQLANLETIGRSGEHLLALINDVLEFSKIEAGRIEQNPEIFDLYRLLLSLEEMFGLRAEQQKLSLVFRRELDVPQFIRADANKLRQVLINLLGNAIKFTQKGGVTLSVKRVVHEKQLDETMSLLNFEVVDTGVGIPREDQKRIFEAFFQTQSQPSSTQGTGLGLPISRKFVQLMGGDLKVISMVGGKTTFSFCIPVEQMDVTDTESLKDKRTVIGLADGQPDFRLLVVEDNTNSRNLLCTLLRMVGFEIQEAVNGQEAIEIWKKWHPHLIWMDMRMPVMDGYQATSLIKNSREGKNTIIIAITASAFEEDRNKVIEIGCNDFVRKPFIEAEIFEVIHRHLGVKYIYQEKHEGFKQLNASKKMSDDTLITAINNLSRKTIYSLKEATELSDASMIDRVIEEISTENVALAEALSLLAENFAYDKILSFIQKA